jgi:hypothetical protein
VKLNTDIRLYERERVTPSREAPATAPCKRPAAGASGQHFAVIHNAAPPPARCPVPGRVEERASRPKQVRHNHRMSSRTHVSNAIPAQAEEVVNEACPRSRRSCRPKKLVDRLRCPSEQRVLCGGGRPAFPAQSSTRQPRCPRRGCAHASLSRLSQTRALAGCLVPRPHPRLPSEFASVACFQVPSLS